MPNHVDRLSLPAGRLFDEYTKLFLHGHAQENYKLLVQLNALNALFPHFDSQDQHNTKLLNAALINTDNRHQKELPINPAFLLAVFFYGLVYTIISSNTKKLYRTTQVLCFNRRSKQHYQNSHNTPPPRHFANVIRQIWQLQHVLENRQRKRIRAILDHRDFAAYDFLLLRQLIGDISSKVLDWWTHIQTLDTAQQNQLIEQRPSQPRKRRRRKEAIMTNHLDISSTPFSTSKAFNHLRII